MAIITAFLDMLPILGTGTILIPYILIELFSKNYGLCIGLLVVYLLSQIIRRIIEPKVEKTDKIKTGGGHRTSYLFKYKQHK